MVKWLKIYRSQLPHGDEPHALHALKADPARNEAAQAPL
jgi:hypothetical protein